MRLGIGSYTYTWAVGVPGWPPPQPLSAFELVRRAAGFGLGLVQICDNLPLNAMPADQREALRALAAELGVCIQVGTRGSRLAHLRSTIRIAAEFSSSTLRLVLDSPGDEPSPAEAVRRLRRAAPELEAAGIRLAIENHDRLSAAAFREIVESVNSPWVGICLDTVNSFGALEGPEQVAATLLPYTFTLHIKDFIIRRHKHMMGFEISGAPAGRGRLDIPGLLGRLRAVNPDADAVLELWTPPEAEIEATLRKEAEWAEISLEYLKPFFQSGAAS